MLVGLLRFDKRSSGGKGLCLVSDVPSLKLRAGDRLEPSAELPDIGRFSTLKEYPVVATFWRSADQSLVQHRCPLFDPALGILPYQSLVVDELHALHLGVYQEYA
eukprot:13745657-Alexandrium_andersonii.AAC.1